MCPNVRTDEIIRLVEGNARQMMGILKNIYPNIDYESHSARRSCAGLSEGGLASCLWSDATGEVSRHDEFALEKIQKLLTVCLSARSIFLWTNA